MTHDEHRVWSLGINRMTIRPAAIPHILEHFPSLEIPFISSKAIAYKSKANHLAKSIVCIQVLWFCTQFFGRWAKGLPATLLELNTVVHSICALLIYITWWDKPLDIDEPTVIHTKSSQYAKDACALGFAQAS